MLKSILFVVFLAAMLFLVFGGLILTDYAKHSFWWNFWDVTPWVGGVGFVGGIWWYLSTRQQN